MKKFSTVLGTMAAGALLATAGVGAASAAGPEADTVDLLRSAVAGGMEEMRSALTDAAPASLTSAGATEAGTSETGADGASKTDMMGGVPMSTGALEGTGTPQGVDGGIRDACVGTLLESEDLVNGYGTTIGRVELWYSSTAGSGGQNCVITHNYLDGDATFTDASIWVDDDNFGGGENRWRYDEGHYYSYAGGSFLNDVNGKCTAMYGQVNGHDYGSDMDDASYMSDWYHCG
ncbi:hypothetical protein NF556_09820 [Ornithinimicrobium faecis]|uniref:Secreted protein n=1 Tax=Ornithinimicrobium faecis TaxID=2934158 RepID=A0ABY4YYQ4_9MICO|nr:hypothetical protein [Ornithinimicrobium sp. HY1793]USQ81913.1 hypothetical protein NF556_09820 [Ornithinimicrobium sp. HY1793]